MAMTDVTLSKKWNIPLQTLYKWKKADKDNWRFKIYTYLKEQ
jgi:predicted transcriptional regulator